MLVSTNKITSGRMLGCYILCSKILVEMDRLIVKVEVDQQQVEIRGRSKSSQRLRLVEWVKSKSRKIDMVKELTTS
jgi:hypothetical protein